MTMMMMMMMMMIVFYHFNNNNKMLRRKRIISHVSDKNNVKTHAFNVYSLKGDDDNKTLDMLTSLAHWLT
jgi:hypothetical protein